MTLNVSRLIAFAALISFAMPAMGQQYYLYSPQAASSDAKPEKAKDGILVSEIVIRKGDTLSGLSKKYNGKGSYYPQILLFNDIKNPNLIRTGDSIRVPLQKGKAAATVSSKSKQKGNIKQVQPVSQPAKSMDASIVAVKAGVTVKPASEEKSISLSAATGPDEQKLFEQGSKAYRAGDCSAAIKAFERIQENYPSSSLAADAGLYKADCLLKMSGQ